MGKQSERIIYFTCSCRKSRGDITVSVIQSQLGAVYQFTDHVGLNFWISYFDTDVTVEDDLEKQEISYDYNGASLGVHFTFQLVARASAYVSMLLI